MNLDDLTLGQIKTLRGLLGGTMDAMEICPHLGEYVIVRTQSAGVFAGVLRSKNGCEVVIDKCRRLWLWFAVDGIELDGVAANGIDQSKSKIGPPTDGKWTTAIEIIPTAAAARKSIEGAKNASK